MLELDLSGITTILRHRRLGGGAVCTAMGWGVISRGGFFEWCSALTLWNAAIIFSLQAM